MTIEQALKTLDTLAAVYKGTRDEHVALSQALSVLSEAVKPKEDKPE
jgi:hypothetical protein